MPSIPTTVPMTSPAVDAFSTVVSSIEAVTSSLTVVMTSSSVSTPVEPATSETYADDLHFVMSAVVGPVVAIFGLLGNLLSMATWCRNGLKGSTGRYLTGQALADLFVLIMFLLCDSAVAWCPGVKKDKLYGVFYSYIGYPAFFFSIITSIWITVAVTVDRYLLVCWINKAKTFCNEKRANFGLALVAVNCFFINIPHFASYTPILDTPTNYTGPAYKETVYQTSAGGQFYEFWVHCIILILVPWVSVLAMNISIINKISDSNKKMADKKSSGSVRKSRDSETQVTRLLLTVTFTFLVFIGLQCIIQCLWMQKPSWANMTDVSAAFAFAKTGVVFNSASNFVLYCLTGRRFRTELLTMLGLARREPHLISVDNTSGSHSTTSTTSTTGM